MAERVAHSRYPDVAAHVPWLLVFLCSESVEAGMVRRNAVNAPVGYAAALAAGRRGIGIKPRLEAADVEAPIEWLV